MQEIRGEREQSAILYDVVIVGGGPAGMSAAIYAQRAGLNAVLLEAQYVPGGQVLNTDTVENYPGLPDIGGAELAEAFRGHALQLGASLVREKVTALALEEPVKRVITRKHTYETRTVLLAMGASHKTLDVPGEEMYAGQGVSYCATCDGAFYRDKIVAVIGGGDVAAEDAIYLSRMAKQVYLIHRRASLRAAASLQKQLLAIPTVKLLWNTEVREIRGAESGLQLCLNRHQRQEENPDHQDGTPSVCESGADTVSGHTAVASGDLLAVDGCFIAVGIRPNTALVQDLVACDENGFILAGEDGVTSCPGVFAAGDLRTAPLRQILTAAADGANCIASVQNYLNGSTGAEAHPTGKFF